LAQEQQPGPRLLSRENVLSLYLPAVTLGLGSGIAAPALPVFAKSFDVSVGAASWVFTMYMVGSLVATIPIGYLVDRIGRRKILLSGPVLVALASFLTARAESFPELLLYRFLGGAAQQMWMMARLAMITDVGASRQRGRQITGMVGANSAGNLLGPAVGGFVAAWWDIRIPFILHGLLSLLSIVPSFKSARETAPTGKGRAAAAGASADAGLMALLTVPVLAFFLAQFLGSVTRGSLFGGTVNLYPVYAYGVDAAVLGVLGTVTAAIGIPITFASGAIMDRFGRKANTVPGFLLLGAALAFTAYTAYVESPFAWFVVAYIAFHTGQAVTSGNMQVIGSDIAPERARGKFFGVWRLIGEIGQVVSPICFGVLASGEGYGAAFVFLSASSFATALVLATLLKETLGPERARQTASR
jgi:MFS family permease